MKTFSLSFFLHKNYVQMSGLSNDIEKHSKLLLPLLLLLRCP